MQLNDRLAGAKLPRLDGAEPRALLMPTITRARRCCVINWVKPTVNRLVIAHAPAIIETRR